MADEASSSISNPESPSSKSESSFQKSLDTFESELQCSICTELFIKAVTLNCSHTFCKFCINQWKKNKSICPICRKGITNEFPTLVLDTYIEKVLDSASPETKQKRLDLITQRDKDTTKQDTAPPQRESSDLDSNDSSDDDFDIYDSYDEEEDEDEWEDDHWEDVDNISGDTDEPESESQEAAEEEEHDLPSGDASAPDTESCSEENEGTSQASGQEYNGIEGAYFGGYGHCFHCGDTGHWANGCPQRGDLACFTCKRFGHFSNACPNRNVLCYKCGRQGHRAAFCTF